jgi:uncharacterized protein (DUF1684 family)
MVMTSPAPVLNPAGPIAPASVVDTARAGWQAWRDRRLDAVVAPTGNLALVETRWLAPGQTESLTDALAGRPSTVTATTLTRRNLGTGEPERGIRLWDAASKSMRNFETITAWEFNSDWVISAKFSPVETERVIPFEHIRDNGGTRDLVVPGDITFSLGGTDYRFSAFDDDGTLLLVFGDATNGASGADGYDGSYEAGRFLFVGRDAVAFGEPGPVVLDFNRAFVPPCGFSIHYNCPLPPRSNRFSVPVEAGEKAVSFRDGHTIY